MTEFHEACKCLHRNTIHVLEQIPIDIKNTVTDIVLRKNNPLCVVCRNQLYFVGVDGCCNDKHVNAYIVSEEEVNECILRACRYSVYAHKQELLNGFISLGNGCRLALIGRLGLIKDAASDFSCIDAVKIRIARNITANTSIVFEDRKICSALIVGPPASGKTTMLRSIAKALTDGSMGRIFSVSVVDERNEIFPKGLTDASCVDVISGISKTEGINIAVRLFSPEIVICDEIGTLNEAKIIRDSLNCGVRFICSMHAIDADELFRRNVFLSLKQDRVFEKIVFLNDSKLPGEIKKIIFCKENSIA